MARPAWVAVKVNSTTNASLKTEMTVSGRGVSHFVLPAMGEPAQSVITHGPEYVPDGAAWEVKGTNVAAIWSSYLLV